MVIIINKIWLILLKLIGKDVIFKFCFILVVFFMMFLKILVVVCFNIFGVWIWKMMVVIVNIKIVIIDSICLDMYWNKCFIVF